VEVLVRLQVVDPARLAHGSRPSGPRSFAIWFYVLALVVLSRVELATAPERTGPNTQPDHRRSP
jgi:hypothetical protein